MNEKKLKVIWKERIKNYENSGLTIKVMSILIIPLHQLRLDEDNQRLSLNAISIRFIL